MRLLSVGMWGFRRFADDRGDMDVAGDVVAVVGPNEAGKTSFFKGLCHLDRSDDFAPEERTRHGNRGVCVRALFSLDDDDQAELSGIRGAEAIRQYRVRKREGAGIDSDIDQPLTRDLAPRAKALDAISKAQAGRWHKQLPAEDELRSRLAQVNTSLESDAETLESAAVAAARDLGQALTAAELPASVRQLGDRLTRLADHEAAETPREQALQILNDRRPEFLFFSDEHRILPASWDVSDALTRALENLFSVASLDLDRLRQAIGAADQSTVEEIEEGANAQLKQVFEQSWKQARITVRLRVDQTVIYIMVSNRPGRYINITERSDGLRQFIALLAYIDTHAKRATPPVLLIDEAESHLHYDAQADLVRVFAGQPAAAKVIYTTHSAGCLPQDLGTGIRVIEPVGPDNVPADQWEHSQVHNWFWTKGQGFSPLLIAMGASAFAFAATRYAVFVEGITEVILLPTLLREVSGREDLDFQIAPGLAEVSEREAPDLDLAAAKVAYLVDGDKAGKLIRKKLRSAGVPAKRILGLGASGGRPLTLEDFLDHSVYCDAVNAELQARSGVEIPTGKIKAVGRAAAVEQWCRRDAKVDPPSKRAIAHRVLDMRYDRSLHAATRRVTLKRLLAAVEKTLDVRAS